MAPLRIGFLHMGPAAHGVRRYGTLMAARAAKHEDVEIVEAESVLTGEPRRDDAVLAEAGGRLSAADVVHLQYNDKIWGGRRGQLGNLRTFVHHCGTPLVATLHDLYEPPRTPAPSLRVVAGVRRRLRALYRDASEPAHGQHDRRIALAAARAAARTMAPYSYAALCWLLDNVQVALVSSGEEINRLNGMGRARVGIVPHFVEERVVDVDPVKARAALEMENKATVTVLGFIHPRKGHHLVVEALAQLGTDVQAVFVGRATTDGSTYLGDVLALAEARGVRGRLRVTGYVPEEVLDLYLAATDLALCPFLACSASGSLSTWISVGRPIIASDLPQVAEYNAAEPGAIDVFRPLTATALAHAIRSRLGRGTIPESAAVSRLARRLAISAIFGQHLSWYRTAARLGV